MTEKQIKALKEVCDAIIQAVKAAGSLGAPAGTLYAVLMSAGCTMEQFDKLMSGLVRAGMLRKQGHLYFAI